MKRLSILEQMILSDELANNSLANNSFISKKKPLYSEGLAGVPAPRTPSDVMAEVKAAARKLNVSFDPGVDVDALDKGFKIVVDALQLLSFIPMPVPQPFSLALVGDSLAKKDYLGSFLNLLGAIPNGGMLVKLTKLSKAPTWVTTLINYARQLGLSNVVIQALKWLANSLANINLNGYTLKLSKAAALDHLKTQAILSGAQPVIREIGKNLLSTIQSSENPAPTPKLVTSPSTSLGDVYNYQKLNTENLKKMLANPAAYQLDASQVSKVQQELDDREVDKEVGAGRN
jgi:hypothetical protein